MEFTLDGRCHPPTDVHPHRYRESEGVFKLKPSQKVREAATNAFTGNAKLVKPPPLIWPDKSIYLATKQTGTRRVSPVLLTHPWGPVLPFS